ncbi:hypothetical protein GN316_14410 [Xylophilus sp. Kf1]|nr:hypothetical protein [Xylophilus sp. Kf1]
MPYDTLETIHDAELPLLFTSCDDAHAIRSYVAAGLVVARFEQQPTDKSSGVRPESIASVEAITPAGRKTIEKLRAGRSMKAFRGKR